MTTTTLGGVRSNFGVAPRVLSDLFYNKIIDDDGCTLIGRTRLIPITFLPKIEAALRERGKLPASQAEVK